MMFYKLEKSEDIKVTDAFYNGLTIRLSNITINGMVITERRVETVMEPKL